MTYVKWTVLGFLTLIVVGFFHYTLPQHDVVRIVGTYQERQDLGDWTRIFWSSPDDQAATLTNRDVQFIQAVEANGDPMVYRNEDTGWGWPPYFKFDTASLQTEADDLKSTREAPKWVVVTHYGWRSELISIFPNAVGIYEVEGPDARVIPWVNIILLTLLALIVLTIRAMLKQFKERSIDPVLADVEEAWDEVEARADAAGDEVKGLWGRFRAWLGTWKGKPRK
ncbi:MAG: DUF1523 family protein [Paracoccaceae bacterium]